MTLLASLLLFAAASPDAPAASPAPAPALDELCTNRPGFATAPCVIGARRVQLEFSLAEWSRARSGDDLERGRSLLPFELRIGLDKRTDVSVAMAPLLHSSVRTSAGTERASGAGDLTLSMKHVLTADQSKLTVSVKPFVTLPTGSSAFTAGRVGGGLLLPMSTNLTKSVSLTVAPEVDVLPDSEGPGRHARAALASAVWVDLTEGLSVGVDTLFAREHDGADHLREAQASLSATYRASANVQLDAGVARGFASASPDLSLSSGVVIRF